MTIESVDGENENTVNEENKAVENAFDIGDKTVLVGKVGKLLPLKGVNLEITITTTDTESGDTKNHVYLVRATEEADFVDENTLAESLVNGLIQRVKLAHTEDELTRGSTHICVRHIMKDGESQAEAQQR